MLKQLVCVLDTARIRVAWFSFQRDRSISFGLNDDDFLAPRQHAFAGLWNAYNRIQTQTVIHGDERYPDPIRNPHFTFHPATRFQLRANRIEPIFIGFTDTMTLLQQQPELQWIRGCSRPIHLLGHGEGRGANYEGEWPITAGSGEASLFIALDLLSQSAPRRDLPRADFAQYVEWGAVVARIVARLGPPSRPTLAYFDER